MENQNNNQNNSLLDEIIASSKENTNNVISSVENTTNPQTIENFTNLETKAKPVSPATILKFIGALLLVILIFFGSFLSYVVFNPEQAQFFVNVFRVDPNDIANLLKKLINYSFGIITFFFSIAFIITLFKAIWTPREQKRKKVMSGFIAWLMGILLFSTLWIWATIYAKIGTVNFSNLAGSILIYENDLFIYNENIKDKTKEIPSKMESLNNLIGPVTLRYDISEHSRKLERENWMEIIDFEFNFDGANCSTGSDVVAGNSPKSEKSIVCTFDKVKKYQPKWRYIFEDFAGNQTPFEFNLDSVEIRWLVNISEQENSKWDTLYNIDASNIIRLWKPIWYRSDIEWREYTNQNSFTVTIGEIPIVIGLKIFADSNNIDKYFIAQKSDIAESEWDIEIIQNSANPQEYVMSLKWLTIDDSQIISVDWSMNTGIQICKDQKDITCTYTFTSYWEWQIIATVNLIGNRTLTFNKNFRLDAPLNLERDVIVTNRSGKKLNTKETYDTKTKTFILTDIFPPETIFLDARDVISDNSWYVLSNVKWTISDWRTIDERSWERIEFNIKRTTRYNIIADYTFAKTTKTWQADDTKKARNIILLDLERKNITPMIKIQKTSDYVPSKITIDASQSRSEYSEIIKFEFDFGEWKPATVWDAIQTYEYTTSWEKTITLTVTDSNWEKATTREKIILKDEPRTLGFSTSLSPGLTGKNVDFKATGTNWQIEDYLWNFWDNTSIEHGYEVSHSFKKAGRYNVTLLVKYIDWTEKQISQPFAVVDSLE